MARNVNKYLVTLIPKLVSLNNGKKINAEHRQQMLIKIQYIPYLIVIGEWNKYIYIFYFLWTKLTMLMVNGKMQTQKSAKHQKLYSTVV